MKRPSIVFLHLPLIGDKGYLSRVLRNRVPNIPRVGESLYIGVCSSRVVSVEYQGNDYNFVKIHLEPISSSFIKELTSERKALGWKNAWTYHSSDPYRT